MSRFLRYVVVYQELNNNLIINHNGFYSLPLDYMHQSEHPHRAKTTQQQSFCGQNLFSFSNSPLSKADYCSGGVKTNKKTAAEPIRWREGGADRHMYVILSQNQRFTSILHSPPLSKTDTHLAVMTF